MRTTIHRAGLFVERDGSSASPILGYLTAWAAGGTQPVVSTLNALKGQVVANAAIFPAGDVAAISVFVTDTAQVVIDTNGYFGQ